MATMPAHEVFVSVQPKHRRPTPMLAIYMRDDLVIGLVAAGMSEEYQPRHRAEVAS